MNNAAISEYLFNRYTRLVIGALAPLIFVMTQNLHIYSASQLVVSIIFTALISVVLYISSIAVITFLIKARLFNGTFESITLAASIILFLLLLLLLGVLFLLGIMTPEHQSVIPIKHPVLIVSFYALILFSIGFGFSAVKSRFLSLTLYSFVLFSLLHLSYKIIRDSQIFSETVRNHDKPAAIESVQLKKKPNIYLFLLESFHSLEHTKNVYGLDSIIFSKDLTREGYTLYDPVYANYYGTLSSTASMLGMGHSYYSGYRGNVDVSTNTARLISGIRGNKVLDILKNNGYSVAYIHTITPLYRFKNNKIDYTNVEFPFAGLLRPVIDIGAPIMQSIRPFFRFNPRFREWVRNLLVASPNTVDLEPKLEKKDTLVEELLSHISKSKKLNQPVFRFIYWVGAAHTNNLDNKISSSSDIKTKLEYASIWKSQYGEIVKKAEAQILDVVHNIEKDDPDALVILIGDHGAYLNKRMVLDTGIANPNLDDIRKYASDLGLTLADMTKDASSVFLAIKWPKDIQVPVKQTISHVNLFRIIFGALSGDSNRTHDAVPNFSYYLVPGSKPSVYTTVKEGFVLNDWQIFKNVQEVQ